MTKSEKIRKQREEEDYYNDREYLLPKNDSEANKRYNSFRSKDPYPEVASALLNSADIFSYVSKTGMIFPFHHKKLMGASYEVAMKGTIIWWDKDGNKQKINFENPEDYFELAPNSIAFVTLEPMFRIPDYIALRFNLKIKHVYKGLLLGTGPLVDPGFVGQLSIPLHNLTANTYKFSPGDGIIQMEFTKLSPNHIWNSSCPNSQLYKRNWILPRRTVDFYINRALKGSKSDSVISSIPNEILSVKEQVETFKKETDDKINGFEKNIDTFTEKTGKAINNGKLLNIAIIAAVATVMGFACTAIYQLGSANTVKKEQINNMQQEISELRDLIDNIEIQLEGESSE